MAKHNKKRNVGLLHEQLIRHASRMTVDGNLQEAKNTIEILTKNFSSDSELLREFRLFSSLIHTKVHTETLAYRILEESRQASKNHDPKRLMKEKSLLIKDINHTLNEENFYNKRCPQFKIFSTVQALLNEWRGSNRLSPSELVAYEKTLVDHLMRNLEENTVQKSKNADPLILNLMIEKFNEKYGNSLTSDQKKLLENHLMNKHDNALSMMCEIKEKTLKAIESFYQKETNKILLEKREALEKRVKSFVPESTDDSIKKALSLANLLSELETDK